MAPDQPQAANRFRIVRLEQDVQHLQERLEDYGALKQSVQILSGEVANLKLEFGAIRRALYTAALTVAGSAVLLALSLVLTRS